MENFNLTPVAGTKNRVFVQELEFEVRKTESGLIVSKADPTDERKYGTVLAVSIKDENGAEPTVKTGDKVLFSPFAGVEQEHNGIKFKVLKEGEIFAVINDAT